MLSDKTVVYDRLAWTLKVHSFLYQYTYHAGVGRTVKDTISFQCIPCFIVHKLVPTPCFTYCRYSYKCLIKRAHRSQDNPLLPRLEAASAHICFIIVQHHARLTLHLFRAVRMPLHLFALPLVRLVVLERESARPLVCTRLPADPTIAAGKQNAPESNGGEESGA
jgi:hypothetical protein